MRKQITQIFIFQSFSNEYFYKVIRKLRDLGGNIMNYKCEARKCTIIISSEIHAYEKLRNYIKLLNEVEILL